MKWCCGKLSYCVSKFRQKLSGYRAPIVDKNLMTRSGSAVLWVGCFLVSLSYGGVFFYLLLFSLAMISSFEWYNITGGKRLLYIPAVFMIALPYAAMAYIYNMPHGAIILAWLLLTVCSNDTAAYFLGKNFGERKIMPMISPNKTWVGMWGGIAFSAVCTLVMSIVFGIFFVPNSLFIGAGIAVVAQLGDFVESGMKRLCNVKDSGFIIPGHGGVMDRMDGFIFAAPLVAAYIMRFSKFFAG